MEYTVEQIIRSSVRSGQGLRIKYWPNKNGEQLVGWRNLLPLRVYNRKGITYFLAWYLSGSSVSREGVGYRLYFMENINSVEEQGTLNLSYDEQVLMSKRDRPHLDYLCLNLVLKNQIE